MSEELDFEGNGHNPSEEENAESLTTALKRLGELKRGDSPLITFGKQELSLMQKILSTGNETYHSEDWWRMCDFLDDDEAFNHVAAFFEAADLGMDTHFNVAYAYSLVSANRKSGKTNLIAMLLDALQHGKWASAPQGSKAKQSAGNSRSALS